MAEVVGGLEHGQDGRGGLMIGSGERIGCRRDD